MLNREEKIGKLLEGLLDEIGICPEPFLEKEAEIKNYSGNCQKKTKKAACSIQDSADNLRICMKYLLFDLDATRRENLYYRRLLESKDF